MDSDRDETSNERREKGMAKRMETKGIRLTFPTLRFNGQRTTRLLEKNHRSWLTLLVTGSLIFFLMFASSFERTRKFVLAFGHRVCESRV